MHSHDILPQRISSSSVNPFSTTDLMTNTTEGAISEIAYHQDQLWVTHCILLPLLQQLGLQSRWQLWLTPEKKLSKSWLTQAGLPLHKMMQVHHHSHLSPIEVMEKALRTGSYSVVICWLDGAISDDDNLRLSAAARAGHTLGLIMRPMGIMRHRPHNAAKIHSSLFH